jgi:uncharacterized protein YbaR (Trm112 family)
MLKTYIDIVKCPQGHKITILARRVSTAGRTVQTYCGTCRRAYPLKAGPLPKTGFEGLQHNDAKRLPAAKKPLRERDVEAYLVKRVKALGGEVRKVKWIGRNGAPDRVVMLPPMKNFDAPIVYHYARTIWVELKTPGKKPEPHQTREHERMRKMGQRVEVVDSFERVDEVLS